jgi:hypothetical protein
MNENWNELVELATQKSDILGQANDRKMLLEIIQDANARLNDVEKQLSSKDYGLVSD